MSTTLTRPKCRLRRPAVLEYIERTPHAAPRFPKLPVRFANRTARESGIIVSSGTIVKVVLRWYSLGFPLELPARRMDKLDKPGVFYFLGKRERVYGATLLIEDPLSWLG
jgi:hypothetical protein